MERLRRDADDRDPYEQRVRELEQWLPASRRSRSSIRLDRHRVLADGPGNGVDGYPPPRSGPTSG
jgi:hypothetical protein